MKFKAKKDTWWCKVVAFFSPAFMVHYWTTVGETIYYPSTVPDPTIHWYRNVIEHEKIHIEQYRKYSVPLFLFLYLLVPLPIFFAYFRWKFEREAYLIEIKAGGDIEDVVDALWSGYVRPWPKSLMRKWFQKNA